MDDGEGGKSDGDGNKEDDGEDEGEGEGGESDGDGKEDGEGGKGDLDGNKEGEDEEEGEEEGEGICSVFGAPKIICVEQTQKKRSHIRAITNHRLRLTNANEIWECSTIHSLALRRPPTAFVPCRRPPPSRRDATRRVASSLALVLVVSVVGRRGSGIAASIAVAPAAG
jgi:hypothetical protein